jgi:iron(III) transport system ATP-binding protein
VTNPPADLVIADLHKSFGSHPVLRGVALTVPAGTFAAIVGQSGSGKTTLLRILAGFERPDRGSVAIGGVPLDDGDTHVRAEQRRIGYVPQEGSLFPHLSVEANVGFGLSRRDRRGSRVPELLGLVGLEGLGHRYPHELSGGQQQRVALARALAVQPRLILLDEPFAALDASLRASLRDDVQTILSRAGTTAILVTHDQDEALSVADLVAVIRDGCIAQVDAPQRLYASPVDVDLGGFIGEANVMTGIARGDRIETPLGLLEVRGGVDAPFGERMTVLVRPEQVWVFPYEDGPGVAGKVVHTGFHGHDSIIGIAIESDALPRPITSRVLGALDLAPGAPVRINIRGPVNAWPQGTAPIDAADATVVRAG